MKQYALEDTNFNAARVNLPTFPEPNMIIFLFEINVSNSISFSTILASILIHPLDQLSHVPMMHPVPTINPLVPRSTYRFQK